MRYIRLTQAKIDSVNAINAEVVGKRLSPRTSKSGVKVLNHNMIGDYVNWPEYQDILADCPEVELDEDDDFDNSI